MYDKPVALVSGGNRGLGLATCAALAAKGYQVLLGSRDLENGKAAANSLGLENIRAVPLDVSLQQDIDALASLIDTDYGRLDVLINNAGILIDAQLGEAASICDTSADILRRSFEVNTIAAVMLINAMLPLMRKAKQARIVNISSGMGQLSDMGGHYPGYRISKTALNSVTTIYAAELDSAQLKINSVCPGWVRTDMGGENAELSPEQGVDTTVWLATSTELKTSGGFFRNRKQIDW
ncbi:MAG: NAD(P)-dependent dehydrogenase (short-subunit alcohol dehydrogenase family) [Gammaproteobacteria bacterium]|jgi:NAD(P)-dependent dehydrogenase (short-subunit alcohol dehydrogenase family)